MRDEAEALARKIARGDRSHATAKAYLEALGPESGGEWLGTVRLFDSGELSKQLERIGRREFRFVLIDDAWYGTRWGDRIGEVLDKIREIVPFHGEQNVRLLLLEERRTERAHETLTGEEFWSYVVGVAPRPGWTIVRVADDVLILLASVPPLGEDYVSISVLVNSVASPPEFACSADWKFSGLRDADGRDEITVDVRDGRGEAAADMISADLERELISRIKGVRRAQLERDGRK